MKEKILQHPKFGPVIKNWINHKTICRKTKNTISLSIIAAFSISLYICKASIMISSLLVSGMLLLLIYINTRAEQEETEQVLQKVVSTEEINPVN